MKKFIFILILASSSLSYSSPCEDTMQSLETIPIQKVIQLLKNMGKSNLHLRAVEEAHRVGKGEIGKDGIHPARIGNYTETQLRRKTEILKQAGFSPSQIRTLMEAGVVGLFGPTKGVLYRYGRRGVAAIGYPIPKRYLQSMVKSDVKHLTNPQLRTLNVEHLRDAQLKSFDNPDFLRRVPVKKRHALEDRVLRMTKPQRERLGLKGLKKRLKHARENNGNPYFKNEHYDPFVTGHYYGE